MTVTVVTKLPCNPCAVITGDVHIAQHSFQNQLREDGVPNRVHWGLKCLEKARDAALTLGVPLVINGDLTHQKNALDPVVTSLLHDFFKTCTPTEVFLVVGNHELPDKHKQLSCLDAFAQHIIQGPRVQVIKTPTPVELREMSAVLVPFAHDHKESAAFARNKAKLRWPNQPVTFIGHFPVDGANLGKHTLTHENKIEDFLPDAWNGLLFNDIHRHQAITDKAYHLGAPMQNTFGESGYDCGLWLVGSVGEDVYLERIPFNAPQFFYAENDANAEDLRKQGHYVRIRSQAIVKKLLAEETGKARMAVNMNDLDSTFKNYVKFQIENGKILAEDETAVLQLASSLLENK